MWIPEASAAGMAGNFGSADDISFSSDTIWYETQIDILQYVGKIESHDLSIYCNFDNGNKLIYIAIYCIFWYIGNSDITIRNVENNRCIASPSFWAVSLNADDEFTKKL